MEPAKIVLSTVFLVQLTLISLITLLQLVLLALKGMLPSMEFVNHVKEVVRFAIPEIQQYVWNVLKETF